MRLRIMLVDDEPMVLQGLRTIIDRANEDWEISGEYKNGAEALAALKENNPDVVITDIKMPVMGGLEFVEQARAINSNIKFIILSGFADFAYAQQSIRLETVDYILKPPHFKDILSSIKKAERLKQENESRIKENVELKEFKKEAFQLFKEKYLSDFIHKSNTGISEQDMKTSEEFGIFFNKFVLFIIKLDDFSFFILDSEDDKLRKLTLLRNEIRKSVHKRPGCLLDLYDGTYVCFINVRNSSPVYLKGQAREMLSEIDQNVKENMTIGISRTYESPDMLNVAYKECLHILRNKVFYEKNSMIHIDEVKLDKYSDNYPLEMEQKYIELLMFADYKKASELLLQIVDKFIEVSHQNSDAFKSLIIEFVMVVARKLSETVTLNILNDVLGKGIHKKLNILDSIDAVKDFLLIYTKSITDYFGEKNKPGCRKVINDIKAFIQNNYFNEITLKQVAGDFFMNDSYLSELFKKEAGTSFNTYLTGVRIDQAKQLLLQKDLKSKDVAEMVGYHNDWYFCKVFKHYTGKTPIEYKESIIR
jgi:two-component system, response regulator YesN